MTFAESERLKIECPSLTQISFREERLMVRLAILVALMVPTLALAQPPGIRPKGDDRDRPRFKGADQMDRLARRLEREAHELREEVVAHFSGKPGFRDMQGHMQ